MSGLHFCESMPSWQTTLSNSFRRRPKDVGPRSDISELRQQFEHLFLKFGSPPSDAVFEPAQIGPVNGEWVHTANSSPDRVLLYFHGGGYIAGSPLSHRPLVARFAAASEATAFSVDYRLAPEHAFPSAVRDGMDVYRHLTAKTVLPKSVVIAGDGSGGGLAFAVLHAIRTGNLEMPAGCIAMSPWADLTLSGWSMLQNARSDRELDREMLFVAARQYLKKTNPGDPYASPCFANFKEFPPIMVHAGSREILRDDASRLGDRAADANIPVSVEIYDGMEHLFQGNPAVPEAKVSLQRLGQFVRARTLCQTRAAP
jgi:acetyl esterase/lipase